MYGNSRKIKLFPGGDFVEVQANIANVRSRIMEITPPAGHFLSLEQTIAPVIRLLNNVGAHIPGGSRVYIGVQADGQDSPRFAPAFDLIDYEQLSSVEQRRAENRGPNGTLRKELGVTVAAEDENEHIIVELLSSEVVDFAQVGTTFEFLEVNYGTIV